MGGVSSLLDEYAEDFGINFSEKISEDQQRQIKGNPAAYEDLYPQGNRPTPPPAESNTQWRSQYAEQPVNMTPNNYQRSAAPAYNFNEPPPPPPPSHPSSMRSNLDGVFKEESKELRDLLKAEQGDGCLKKMFFTLLSIAIIIASFWASFMVGKKIFLPESRQDKVELPAFLKQRTEAGLRETINTVKKVTGTDDLFKSVAQPAKQARAVPPEVANLYTPRSSVAEKGSAQSVSQKITVADNSFAKPQPPVVPVPVAASRLPVLYRVIAGAYPNQTQAADAAANLKADGFENFVYKADNQYRIQIGAFKNKESATKYMEKAKEYGYNAVLVVK